MKIIAEQGNGLFIAIVSRNEIEKLHDEYYTQPAIPKTIIGSEYDLGAGHDFRNEIKRSCKDMVDATAGFKRAQDAMIKFASMVSEMPEELP